MFRRIWLAALMAVLVIVPTAAAIAGHAVAAPSTSLGDLVQLLSDQRDQCAEMALKAHKAYDSATFDAGLQADRDRQKAQLDAQVYGVGHGNRETTQYYAARLQENGAAQAARYAEISKKLDADREEVKACVQDALTQGKAGYATFKSDPKHKKLLGESDAVMTAWIVNVGEIATSQPQGTESTKTAWATAKAHAELQ